MEASARTPPAKPSGMAKDITPPFTEELEEFRKSVRGWVLANLTPHADEWEASKHFPDEVFKTVASQGGLEDPAQGYLADAVQLEELPACGSGGVAAGIWAHAGIALTPIWKFGSHEQKLKYLKPGVSGDKIAALAITEPGAGSDVAGIQTKAEKDYG
ncbi:MAG: acyl-CoA dehydrogenase family protein, partial [Solirubrobacterales bacterium]